MTDFRLERRTGTRRMPVQPGAAPLAARAGGGWRPKTCQWPEGDPREPDFRFCGAPIEPVAGLPEDRSYCPEHFARAYETVDQQRERRRAARAAKVVETEEERRERYAVARRASRAAKRKARREAKAAATAAGAGTVTPAGEPGA